MGKYDKVLKSLPRLPIEQTDYQEKVDLAKEEYQSLNITELAEKYISVRRQLDLLKDQEKAINVKVEALNQLGTAAFEATGAASIKLEDGASVSLQFEPYPGVGDREKFRLWCLNEGMERSMHLHNQTMKGLINERLLGGLEPPPGVKVFTKVKLTARGK